MKLFLAAVAVVLGASLTAVGLGGFLKGMMNSSKPECICECAPSKATINCQDIRDTCIGLKEIWLEDGPEGFKICKELKHRD